MTRIVEKPTTPVNKLANIGLYYIRAVDSSGRGSITSWPVPEQG
jgi:hypothetical protein